jgi:hypothetical protein
MKVAAAALSELIDGLGLKIAAAALSELSDGLGMKVAAAALSELRRCPAASDRLYHKFSPLFISIA